MQWSITQWCDQFKTINMVPLKWLDINPEVTKPFQTLSICQIPHNIQIFFSSEKTMGYGLRKVRVKFVSPVRMSLEWISVSRAEVQWGFMLIEMTFFLLRLPHATRGQHTSEHIMFKQISRPKHKTNEHTSLGGTKNSQWNCISYCGGCKCKKISTASLAYIMEWLVKLCVKRQVMG